MAPHLVKKLRAVLEAERHLSFTLFNRKPQVARVLNTILH
jgi:hypothetical protein